VDATGEVWAGNPRMAARMGAKLTDAVFERLVQEAQTVIWLGRGPYVLGAVAVADGLRPTSPAALDALRKGGLRALCS